MHFCNIIVHNRKVKIMGNYNKWNKHEITDENADIFVVLFVSRNKDNKHITDFVERTKAFVTSRTANELSSSFNAFVKEGKPGEFCRMYYSVNARCNNKTQKALLHKLIDENYNMSTLPQRIAALAAKKENAKYTKHLKWLFDFDPIENKDIHKEVVNFKNDIKHFHAATKTKKDKIKQPIKIETYKTPNGYAVIVDQRFDTRELLKKWKNVELKRDDLYCVYSKYNEPESK